MKKLVIITMFVAAFAFVGIQQASARMGYGPQGYGDCQNRGGATYQQMDEATKAKYDAFFETTKELRKEIAMKRAAQRANMKSENPDTDKAAKLAGEMFDLRMKMRAQAKEAGVEMGMGHGQNGGFKQGRSGMGPHHGKGSGHMQGYSGRGMW